MGTTTKTLYETDFVEWASHTSELIRQGRLSEVDLENVAEEIEDLGKSERSAVYEQLSRLMMHLVKMRIQPERADASWRASINGARLEIQAKIRNSPSLRRYLNENQEEIYREALRGALFETGLEARSAELGIPQECPWTLTQLLEGTSAGLDRW